MIANHTDRYSIATKAIRGGAKFNPVVASYAHEKISYLRHLREKEREYILANGKGTKFVNTPSSQILNFFH